MIILTIPFKNNRSILTDPKIEANFIEYRLDYCLDYSTVNWSLFSETNIITVREKEEGGFSDISVSLKKNMISLAQIHTKSLIDCEYAFLNRYLVQDIPSSRLILSLHTEYSKQGLINDFLTTTIKARYYKFAVSCNNLNQFDDLIKQVPPDKRKRMILIPLYPSPLTLRLAYKLYSSIATYVYLNESVAVNQPDLSLAVLCRINQINPNTTVFGIVGGQQVISSLSLIVYNNWFKLQQQNKVMLPITEASVEEVLSLVNWLSCRTRVKGIAITMPFKKKLVNNNSKDNYMANSWLPVNDSFKSTDEFACQKALDYLVISRHMSVLILGTGATSETAINVFERNRIKDITIYNRQRCHQSELDNGLSSHRYDLLINCTPLGFSEEDNLNKIPSFDRLIDLPYGKTDSLLVRKAKSENLPFVDGFMFWKWQAEAQAEFFGLEPEFKDYINSLNLQSLLQ
jgi:shikimate 5-dehydrogenase/3-dehydroquinate dehydratase